ncbi:MAG: hypothetical protein EAS48_11025 [Chryseobacterium sp.]|nr:MAG: hypothetical protein EAS48_11025 [Chryseobacterium sp.]
MRRPDNRKRDTMKKFFLITALCSLSVTGAAAVSGIAAPEARKCTGSKNCKACSNCKYCKHCAKNGGHCGVCR